MSLSVAEAMKTHVTQRLAVVTLGGTTEASGWLRFAPGVANGHPNGGGRPVDSGQSGESVEKLRSSIVPPAGRRGNCRFIVLQEFVVARE